jgi:hypothetical protein
MVLNHWVFELWLPYEVMGETMDTRQRADFWHGTTDSYPWPIPGTFLGREIDFVAYFIILCLLATIESSNHSSIDQVGRQIVPHFPAIPSDWRSGSQLHVGSSEGMPNDRLRILQGTTSSTSDGSTVSLA